MDRFISSGVTTASVEPFTRVKIYEWFICDVPGYEGLAAEIYCNQTIGEERAEEKLWQQLVGAEIALADVAKTVIKSREVSDQEAFIRAEERLQTAEAAYLAFIAPRIRNWNLNAEDAETGEIVPVPSPAVAGVEAFYLLETPVLRWLKPKVHLAALGKHLSRMRQSAESELTPEPKSEDSDPKAGTND